MRLPLDLPLTILLGAYPALYLAAITHECGHALVASGSGFRVTSLGLGTGRPFLRFALPSGTIFYLCRDEPLTGFCWTVPANPHRHQSRTATLPLLLGGSLANLFAGVLLLALWRLCGLSIFLVLGVLQIALGLSNLVPFALPVGSGGTVLSSDGARALALVALRHHRAQAPAALLALRSLWEAVGDDQQLRARLQAAADAADSIGDTALAARYREEATAFGGGKEVAYPATEEDAADALLGYLQVSLPEAGRLETLLAHYEASRRRERYDTHDLRVYFAVARARRELNDAPGVEMAWEQVRTAARAVDTALASDSEARNRFRERMRTLDIVLP